MTARSYSALQFEAQQDERRELESRGLIAPNHDGTPRTVVQGRPLKQGDTITTLYRARCSCAWSGNEYGAATYALANQERKQHRCATTQAALDVLRKANLL